MATKTADIFIQAGHENAPSGTPQGAEGSLGKEKDWTPIVANETARILKEAGISVIREDASLRLPARANDRFKVKVAVFLHFDGDKESGKELGACIGYKGDSDKPAAQAWKTLYKEFFPFKWEDDNYTDNLSGYYGYKFTITSDAEFLIEFGDIETNTQAQWLKPRLKWLGALLAHFLANRIGNTSVPKPAAFNDAPIPHPTPSPAPEPNGMRIRLPDYAKDILGSASGMPWSKASPMPETNGYVGMFPDSFAMFKGLDLGDGLTTALLFEGKFGIDNDGSGGNEAGDPNHQSQTSLRDAQGRGLNASKVPFAVIPLDRDETTRPKKAGLPDFGDSLGLRLGDLGVCFWRRAKTGDVASAFFVFADKGPQNNVGEGSVKLADELKINSNPNTGGYNAQDILDMGKGVIFIAFPGSGKKFLLASTKTSLTVEKIRQEGARLLAALMDS
jgi:hypothetical protein